jgi:hypothetical protein
VQADDEDAVETLDENEFDNQMFKIINEEDLTNLRSSYRSSGSSYRSSYSPKSSYSSYKPSSTSYKKTTTYRAGGYTPGYSSHTYISGGGYGGYGGYGGHHTTVVGGTGGLWCFLCCCVPVILIAVCFAKKRQMGGDGYEE